MFISDFVSTMNTIDNITPNEKRMCLFNVNEPIELSIEEFEKNWWPLVTNIWTQYNSYKHVNGDFWRGYVCRLAKHRESSTRQEGVLVDKHQSDRQIFVMPRSKSHG